MEIRRIGELHGTFMELNRSVPTILVAEDDPDAVFLLKTAFREVSPDTRVVYTGDGLELLRVLQGKEGTGRGEPSGASVLVLDLKMPRMDGYEVLHWLRRFPGVRPETVLILSASPRKEDIEMTRQLGADYYFVKPCSYAEFKAMVRGIAALAHSGQLPPTDRKDEMLIFRLRGGSE